MDGGQDPRDKGRHVDAARMVSRAYRSDTWRITAALLSRASVVQQETAALMWQAAALLQESRRLLLEARRLRVTLQRPRE